MMDDTYRFATTWPPDAKARLIAAMLRDEDRPDPDETQTVLPEYRGLRGRQVRWSRDNREGRELRHEGRRHIGQRFTVMYAVESEYGGRPAVLCWVRFDSDGAGLWLYERDVRWLGGWDDDDGSTDSGVGDGDDGPSAA